MKKIILFFLLLFGTSIFCQSQEWISSLDVAKRLAFAQDKMVFMLWEGATKQPYPVLIDDGKNGTVVNLFEDENVNEILWEYFIPVRVSETMYEELISEIEEKRELNYIKKFNDDSIKIMDVNGNILVTVPLDAHFIDLEKFIITYALNTSFLKEAFKSYRKQQNFYTAFRLASKYLDFSMLVKSHMRKEVIDLSEIYLNEADNFLINSELDNKMAFEQKSKLVRLKKFLILNRPKKVLKQLKKIDNLEIDTINKPLVAFLYYTAYKLLKDEKEATLWKSQVSLADLRYTTMIINSNQ